MESEAKREANNGRLKKKKISEKVNDTVKH